MIIQIRKRGADGEPEWVSYPMVNLHQMTSKLTLNQLVGFSRELAITNISRARSMADVLDIVDEVGDGKTAVEIAEHPEGAFLLAVMVWGARTSAGDKLGLLEACDVTLDDLRFITEGDDEGRAVPGKAPAGDDPPNATTSPTTSPDSSSE